MPEPRAVPGAGVQLAATLSAAATSAVVLAALLFPAVAQAGETLWSCGGGYSNDVFVHSVIAGVDARSQCSTSSGGPGNPAFGGSMSLTTTGATVRDGKGGHWLATAPPGLRITAARIPRGALAVAGLNATGGYQGRFFWRRGGRAVQNGETSAFIGPFTSQYFGWAISCRHRPSCHAQGARLAVGQIALDVEETVEPRLFAPRGLWTSTGWIRSTWPLFFYGSSPSGMCTLSASASGLELATTASGRNQSVWHQCNAPAVHQTVDTSHLGQGAISLTLSGWDGADELVGDTRTIYVDNSRPFVTLTGPTDIPSTAGTPYVTAVAGGSPSGIDGLTCSVDGGAQRWYPGADARIPVTGIGEHAVICSAENNAVDSAGNHAWSSSARWSLAIRDPTVSTIGFENVVNALRCSRTSERETVPAHWVTVHRDGKLILVRVDAHTKLVTFTECHPRTKPDHIPVWVTVRRNGRSVRVRRTKVVEVVIPPHIVDSRVRRVPHGQGTTINGWLGTVAGVGLGGQRITVLSAPDNGRNRFRPAATVVTSSDGGWSAKLSAGPSRLIQAVYKGGPATEPSRSTYATMVVPAAFRFSISPRRTHWRGTIHIIGQLLGSYIPSPGETVYVHVAVRGLCCDIIHLTTSRDGRFGYTYRFDGGSGTYSYRFWVGSVAEADYPFAANRSKVIVVKVE